VLAKMKRLLALRKYRKLLINVGRTYLYALSGYESLVTDELELTQISGSSGRRQTMLRDWLRRHSQPPLPITSQCRPRIVGIEIGLTDGEVIERAFQALASDNCGSLAYQSWYVQVDGHRVSPKWLVHQLTEIPVGEFHSDEARRVLQQLGIVVHRV